MAIASEPSSSLELADMLEAMVLDFRDKLACELAEIRPGLQKDADELKGVEVEGRVKAFTSFLKIIQGIELVTIGIRQQREHDSGRELEVVEFRRQLEEQIARIVDEETARDFSGAVE